jgi:CheY-like chemotaxis protein
LEPTGIILIVDDDPVHLKLYSWIVNRSGYGAVGALVKTAGLELPTKDKFDLVLMDYNFGGLATATSIATKIQAEFAGVPILVLSDQPFMPQDIAPFASGFVRKGDPELLLQTISTLMQKSSLVQ